jgi:hypothetical protein
MNFQNMRARVPNFPCLFLCAVLAFTTIAIPMLFPHPAASQESKESQKKIKNRSMNWNPPDVDARLKSVSGASECDLPNILQMAGSRAEEMKESLPNFTADERIQFQSLGQLGDLQDAGAGTFEYLVVFSATAGGTSIQETRTPVRGTTPFPASTQDVGLPELTMIFLPAIQSDYDMKCEGSTMWNDQRAWVVHFQQRADRPIRTLMFRDEKSSYPAMLKGRAWLSAREAYVIHLETTMVKGIPIMDVKNWWLSLDYAPVQFHSQNVTFWLPQKVDAYSEFTNRRTIKYHTFSNFLLFSVQTKQDIQNPNQPQKPQQQPQI